MDTYHPSAGWYHRTVITTARKVNAFLTLPLETLFFILQIYLKLVYGGILGLLKKGG